jgi:hypothetical protein
MTNGAEGANHEDAGVEVQDNSREKAMAKLLGLRTTGKRSGFDALDELGNPYELKTTSKKDVGTGRDVGRTWIAKLRSGYFVAAKTDPSSGEWEPSEMIFCHPNDLEDWIKDKLESRLGPDENLRDRVVASLSDHFETDEIERLVYIIDRGMTYNNPKISWDYLEKHGTKIDLSRPAEHLSELVKLRPL